MKNIKDGEMKIRNLTIIICIALFFCVFVGGVSADNEYNVTKWTNLVIALNLNVTGPTVLFDNATATYHMWYANQTNEKVFYTSSTDPANFTTGIAVTGLYTSQSCPFVMKENNTYYMINYESTTTVFSIFTSSDGITWTPKGKIYNGTGLSDLQKIDRPKLLKETDGTYKMYFQMRHPLNITQPYYIYLANTNQTTLDSIADGDNDTDFTLVGTTPVLSPGIASEWDGYRVMQPMVVKEGSNYYMWYAGYKSNQTYAVAGNDTIAKIGFAFSSDGINWTKDPGNPILAGVYSVWTPSVFKINNTYHMWNQRDGTFTGGLPRTIQYISANAPILNSISDAKLAAHIVLNTTLATYTSTNYTTANWTILIAFKTNGDTNIDAATNLTAVTTAQDTATTGMAEVPTDLADAKLAAHIVLNTTLATYTSTDYTTANWNYILFYKTEGDTAIDAATDLARITEVQTLVIDDMAGVETIAQTLAIAKTTAHTTLTNALATYHEADYTTANWIILTGYESNGDTNIDAATNLTAVTLAKNTAINGMAGVLATTETTPTADGSGGGSATVTNSTPQVVITNSTQNVTVVIESGTTNPTIDISYFVSNSTVNGTEVITGAIPQITINSSVANVVIPATNVTCANSSWNGVIVAPTVITVTIPNTATETMTTSAAIQIGFAYAELSFSDAVRVLFPGDVGKRVGYIRPGISFTEITDVCEGDNQTIGDALVGIDGNCKINVGIDLVVWTKHFTDFATFSSTAVVPTLISSGGGGGGGGCAQGYTLENGKCVKVNIENQTENKTQSLSPAQLFDIKLELDDAVINNANELGSVITFASFGTVPTFVDLTYSILDSSEKEVYSEKGNVTVTTEQVVRKNFENLNLPDGKYTLVLTTVYGDNVKDEFRQVFEVGKVEVLQSIKNNWILFVIIGVVAGIAFIIFVIIYKRKIKSKREY